MRCVCDDDDVLLCTCYVARERYVVFLFHEIQSIYARRVFVGRVPSRVARFRDGLHSSASRIFVTRSLRPRAFRAVFPFPRQSRPVPRAEHIVHHLRRGVLHSCSVLLDGTGRRAMSVSEKEGENRHPQSHPSHLERGVHEAVDVAAQAPGEHGRARRFGVTRRRARRGVILAAHALPDASEKVRRG